MTAAVKVERYLQDRKKPVTPKQIADYFLYSRSTVNKALNELEQAGKIARTQQRTWHICRMAVPPPSTQAQAARPSSCKK